MKKELGEFAALPTAAPVIQKIAEPVTLQQEEAKLGAHQVPSSSDVYSFSNIRTK